MIPVDCSDQEKLPSVSLTAIQYHWQCVAVEEAEPAAFNSTSNALLITDHGDNCGISAVENYNGEELK